MRSESGGVIHLSTVMEEDLETRVTGLSKPQRIGLADLAASVLTCRSVNTSEIANVLPRIVKEAESKQRYVFRFLANKHVIPHDVMKGYIPDLLRLLTEKGQTAVMMLDQSKISDGRECLMVSLRLHDRGIPVVWKVMETRGPIGFDVQEPLLRLLKTMIPEGVHVLLAADRFYGTASLVRLCQELGLSYRIRLKGNLRLSHEGGEITPMEAVRSGLTSLKKVGLGNTQTNIGIIHEREHPEPWIIAMDASPTSYKTLDYGLRWGIESMFSDFKTRGFRITDTQLHAPERIERLILVIAMAIIWAVSTGEQVSSSSQPSKKKPTDALPPSSKKV